ncbi:hypothetical protein [Rhodohalobacter mucosus]|uniref:DUF3822 domain-containing protein n=1 Tax=Rhodohalobacter mucosus TaxID=2079485 RepID=A0A316TLX5_9BACT|nr:hypothetical protein [Rhodohalobacter mucosus]PWN05577.1 hypothetical protein DDZ15_13315 [Rhodohalobacter mucosus]
MGLDESCLGICYADNYLFYSVNSPGQDGHLKHIGSFEFNFDVKNSIISGDEYGFPALKTALSNLKEFHDCKSVKILAPATEECWTVVPRSVYEDASERESHISLLMHGTDRSDIEATWQPLSNVDYKLLLLRNRASMQGFNQLLGSFSNSEYVSEFEVGADWQAHSNTNGSFLMVNCLSSYISVSSFLLGKLRACTYLHYDNPSDLPYLWTLYSGNLTWMNGIHEKIYAFGHQSRIISEILTPYWDDSGTVHVMNTLQEMGVNAREKTYGFPLESAFPAIMMSLNLDSHAGQPA